MLMLSWNCQRVGRPLTVCRLRDLVQSHRPIAVFLMETKNERRKLERIRNVNFRHYFYIDPEGVSGGLALWWNDSIDIQIFSSMKYWILADCFVESLNVRWLSSFLYADPDEDKRVVVWEFLKAEINSINKPWLRVGDFNVVSCPEDKEEGNQLCSRELEELASFLSECNLMQMEFKGQRFTWSNGRFGDDNILERIDRAAINIKWRMALPQAVLIHEPFCGPDHCPIIVDLQRGLL